MKKELENIQNRINETAHLCGRNPENIRIVGVGKTMPFSKIKQAIDAGIAIIGENYIQEARRKFDELSSYSISWHFIGHLQTNKAKYAVRMFDLIHTVDSLKLAKELNKQAKKIDKIQQILIQVNLSMELAKSGVFEKDAVNLTKDISCLENLKIKGLMTMPPFFNNPDEARPYFAKARNLCNLINKQAMPNVDMNELSMGMSGDFEVAIEEGATLIRIGTAIFGKRN